LPALAPEIVTTDETSDDDKVSHLISKQDWEKAYIMGEPVQALCGKLWVPHKNPDQFPLCGRCAHVFENMFGQPFK
jgi:hypothetical protein